MRSEFLPFSRPSIGDEELREVEDSLRSGWITTGPKTHRFEQLFGEYVGSQEAIAVNSCTAALHLALAAFGVGPDDEVIVPTMTFCSTANVVVHLGAKPVLVDVGDDFNVSPEAIEAAITPKTKAIVPVHYGGQPCDLEPIYELAQHHRLSVVEDAAHAVGAVYKGQKIGADALQPAGQAIRHATAFSFYATKNLTTGEGGMLTTPDKDLAARLRLLSLHGMSHDAWKRYEQGGSWYYEVVEAGYKYNMTDVQAALGIHQLNKLDGYIAVRRQYARRYDQAFSGLPELLTPVVHPDRGHAHHLYVIRLQPERLSINRAQFVAELRDLNIGTSVHFIPVHMHPYYQKTFGYRCGDFPVAEAIYEGIISLPLYPGMSERDVQDVIDAVVTTIQQYRRKE